MNESNELQTEKLINQLFRELTVIFPAFKQAWQNQGDFDYAKRVWVKCFLQAGISTVEGIKYGINKFRLLTCPFVPTPGQFIEMCKPTPEDLGLPSTHQAYYEACSKSHPSADRSEWSHIAVKIAFQKIGSHELSNKPKSQTWPEFSKYYEDATKWFLNGGTIKPIENNSQETNDYLKKREIAKGFEEYNSREKAMIQINELLNRNNGSLSKGLPYDKNRRD